MNVIRCLLTASWRLVALAGLAGLVSGLVGAALIAVIHATLSRLETSTAVWGWSFAGLCLLMFVSRIVSEVVLVRLGQATIATLRLQLSRQILAAPLRHLEELGTHRLLATLTDDVAAIGVAFVQFPMLGINAAMVAGCLVYLGWLSWPVLASVVGVMGLGVAGFHVQQTKVLRALRMARETNDRLFHDFRALLEGVKELKLHRGRRDDFLFTILQGTIDTYRNQFVAGMTRYAVAGGSGTLLFYMAVGLLLFGLPAVQAVDAKTLTGYVLVLLYMMTPVERIVDILPLVGRANVAFKKVQSLGFSLSDQTSKGQVLAVDHPALTEPRFTDRPTTGIGSWKRLELVGVTHSYHREEEDRSFLVGPIDLTFHPGELIFLIGGNGSGKTTLAMLVLGLYPPEAGQIRVDGRLISETNREEYRELFSAVFADCYLFESLLGIEKAQLDREARDYLVRLQLNHKVRIEQGALSTLSLSQGQRKRLALLTAYLEDRSFYVFDEWAADQDPLFRNVFYTQLLPALKARGKTILVITHDDRYFYLADRRIRMETGQISEVADAAVAPSEVTHVR